MIRILDSKQAGRLFARRAARLGEAEAVVRPILEDVRKRGDRALMEYARRLDGLERRTVRVPRAELIAAAESLSTQFREAIGVASANIRAFAATQTPAPRMRQMAPGLRLGQIVRPLDSIAAYIPAGRYPLPSTLMMTVIPAQVAGVKAISVASPRAVKEVYGTAHLLGVQNVFQMGGAHRRPGQYLCGGC
jgi:histidinol dehydrogenase